MCGISGIVAADARVDPLDVAGMAATLAHRGPDERGMRVEGGAGLAHTRLSILDLARGRQPLSNEDDSIWITFNGEIFNYLELRERLLERGHRFRTNTDTEVILHLYEDEGADAVHLLNGQWAFGIWDSRRETLFLSRDRTGICPLFYVTLGRRLLFASEVKALFTYDGVSRALDVRSLDNIFTFWTSTPPRTPFKDVRTLPPAHSLTWHAGRSTIARYWRPTFAVRKADDEPATESVLECALDQAVRLRLRSDVPVGAYLSGGLDSSLTVALMARALGSPPPTFSIAFDDDEFDESQYQREVAQAIGTRHTEIRCSRDDVAAAFPDAVWHAETPLLRTAPAPLFLLAREVKRQGCSVVLTGEGADEMFGGYDIFKQAKVRRMWAAHPESNRGRALLRRLYPYLPALQKQSAAFLQASFQARPGDLQHPCFSHLHRWRTTSRLKVLFSPALRAELDGYDGAAELVASLPSEYAAWDPFFQSQFLEIEHLLPGYLLSSQGDRMAMAHGLECRYPFLDPRVIDFAAGLPPHLKMRALREKHLLKVVARNLLPPSIWKRTKQPYRAPDGRAFFHGRSAEYVEDVLAPSRVRRDGLFNPDAVAALVRKFRENRAIGTGDDMAFVGVLSTGIVMDRFVHSRSHTSSHGLPDLGPASVHRR